MRTVLSTIVSGLVLLALTGCGSGESEAPAVEIRPTADAERVAVDPKDLRIELSNEFVKSSRGSLDVGERTRLQRSGERAIIFLTDGAAQLISEEGNVSEAEFKAGDVTYLPPSSSAMKATAAFEFLTVELLGSPGESMAIAANDATAADAEHHQIVFETDRVRIVRMTYPVGFKTPQHVHSLPGFNVLLGDAHSRAVFEDGESREWRGTAGEAGWTTESPLHTTENLGTADISLLRIELKRKPA